MGRTVNAAITATPTLKREDCKRTKHDSAFSNWKILIGACDWEDYLLNKEGAERYRTHNLPNCASCPGLYELGIAVSLPRTQGKTSSKVTSKYIIPVYLGQADNVRTRLQQYGRDGAHLENGWSNGEQNDRKVLGLFSDIFSYGFAIAFRWAPMESKKDAENTESQLLKTFDYAWNRGMNGERRRDDIHQKLDTVASSTKRILMAFKRIHVFPPKKVGLSIKHCDPPVLEYGSSFYAKKNDTKIHFRIFKFGRSRPTLVSKECDIHNSDGGRCGVALGHGSICTRPPAEGRKRCTDHKGMKINAFTKPRLLINTEDVCQDKHCKPTSGLDFETETFCNRKKGHEEVKHEGIIIDGKESKILSAGSLTCVAVTLNGSFCRRKPSKDIRFCWQHEAMKAKIINH